MQKLGEIIRQRRKEVGISQETLGKRVDYARQHILNIEAGRLSPPDDLLERIARELNLPYKRLLAIKILERLDEEVIYWIQVEIAPIDLLNPNQDQIFPETNV